MRRSRLIRLTAIWLLLSALLAAGMFSASRYILGQAVVERVKAHLSLTLDEALFGIGEDRGNDQEGLRRVGRQVNADLGGLIATRWYAPQRDCSVRLDRIDDVVLGAVPAEQPAGWPLDFTLPRNQKDRAIAMTVTCSSNGMVAGAVCAVLGLLIAAIGCVFPPPLSKIHRQWINYLLERGYSGAQAFGIVRGFDATRLHLNAAQTAALEWLHDSAHCNFAEALTVATDPRVAALDVAAVDWLVLGLQRTPGNLDAALVLACADDAVTIDLAAMTLTIRGLPVPTSGTPLFYYAWYARHRVEGEGWITNPASNRPDRVAGSELIQLMTRYDGHARAINDLERTGLKARTLDQNRSRIKDEIAAVLGEALAEAYLFEASKHPDGVHTRYRLRLPGERIRLPGAA